MRWLYISLWLALAMFAATAAIGRTLYLSREQVTDQFGNQLDFSRAAVGDRIVIIGFTWGGCRSVCPMTDRIMARTQQQLLRQKKPYRLITLTLDPMGDTPATMRKRAKEMGAGAQWLWLGGPYRSVIAVLNGLEANVGGNLETHPPRFIAFDGREKTFIEIPGAPSAEELIGKADWLSKNRLK
jgi:protein SCO1